MQQRSLTSHWPKKTLQSVPSESVQPRDSISYEDKKAIIAAKTELLRERWELGDPPGLIKKAGAPPKDAQQDHPWGECSIGSVMLGFVLQRQRQLRNVE